MSSAQTIHQPAEKYCSDVFRKRHMKIDFELLQKMADAGASAQVVIAVLKADVERDRAEKRKVALRQANRRAAGAITVELRQQVYDRDGWECVYCESDVDLTCDHVVAVKKGGLTTLENLVTACRRCNAKKQDRDRKSFERQLDVQGKSKGLRRKPKGPSEEIRTEATLSDTPRARLFREAKPALLTLNISDNRAGALITQWLKLTNDDDQLVLATILKAQSLAVADAPSWILATLKGKMNERSSSVFPNPASQQSGSTAVFAGVAAAAERRARERSAARQPRPEPGDDDAAERPDPELFGAR